MNFLGQFYTTLAARLLNIVDENENAVIKEINFWNNQYEDYGDTFSHPAVFIEFKSIPFQSVGRNIQMSEMQFNLHIGSSIKARSSYGNQFMQTYLNHFELIDAINFWLTGFRGDFFSSISRTGLVPDHYYGDIIKHVASYQCLIKDNSAERTYTKLEGDKLKIILI